MKPILESVFPFAKGTQVAGYHIENIKVSKHLRKMQVIVEEELTEPQKEWAEKFLKEHLRLFGVSVFSKEDIIEETIEEDTFSETSKEEKKQVVVRPKRIVRDLGNAKPGDVIYGNSIRAPLVPISAINENSTVVCFEGTVFSYETKEIKSKKSGKEFTLVMLDVTDFEDSISVQFFIETKEGSEETVDAVKKAFGKVNKAVEKGGLKAGVYVTIRGKAQYNDYAREIVVMANAICYAEPPEARMDMAEKKRVELHLHTQMSQMDAVSSAGALIDRAASWGHTAIAITDHGVVQSYPDALKASGNNEKIKVIYGVEGYLVDDSARICENVNENSDRFVVFDIETTGLDKNTEEITEIGAVLVENGQVTKRWGTFVNPEKPIPAKITELTSITDDMVADAPKIGEALPEFFEFAKGAVLVAHNAKFDTGFIKEKAKKCGIEYNFGHLDTLMLAKCLYPDLANYRLNTLTKHLNVVLENHHRAVDDAKATADIFVKMLEELKLLGKEDITKLNESFDMRGASKRNRANHIILLAKNLQGVRHIYEMVTKSHLEYFYRTPRLPRSLIEEKRDGLIIGSACEAGELFSAVVNNEPDEVIEKIVSFYDYLEIQPIGNNEYMIRSNDFPHINTDEDLKELNRKIVALGEKYNKPVVATCDVHFMDPEGADYRRILMHYKGFSDADNQAPLYFRTTEEMLEEFAYLGKEKAYEVVVTNTNLIADMVEPVRPIPTTKCPPVIDGAKEGIVNDSMTKAKEIYGDPLPEVVQKRLDKELYSITTYGFSVMYKIAQELVRKSLSDGYLVGSRGSVGSSFVAFLSDITEVNSLPAHYICPNCKNFELVGSDTGISGCDLPDKVCPKCGTEYKKDGHDIPFETFLGFKGDKEPDIDLNFSGEYQPTIHKYTETYFGEGHVFRAGTIGTVAEKTAFGYVKKYAEEKGISIRNAEMKRLATGCVGVKRTSGQHPGGIIVVPYTNDIHEFCPVQHPADDVKSTIITTHFDYHSIDQNLLKLDELGHDDPTVIRMLEDLTGVDAKTIPLGDKKTLSLFTSNEALNIIDGEDIGTELGTYGVPEFGTKFVRQMLEDTKPQKFSELVRISGLSHGTDVWLGNAQELIRQGLCDLSHSICARDDIMIYLIACGVEAGHAFKIMENVRKGKGLSPDDEAAMTAAGVPEWYMDSCKKIKYMFPKAHAVAYVTMAFRIAWFKVYYPEAFYIAYFSVRADDFDASIMTKGIGVARGAIEELKEKKNNGTISPKEENLMPILEICVEMYARGVGFIPIDLYKSEATNFVPTPDGILPPLNALPGMGDNAAKAIVEARADGEFKTIEEFRQRTGATKTIIEMLVAEGCLDIPETDQVSLFD
ncbi:MAG: PolC-type DNA polymerase III [Clostridia bacterium]|nr:PolC-type DNA polymerase III [Clostridia bacterium]